MSTTPQSANIGKFFKSKHTMCILVVLIIIVLCLIYMSWGSSTSNEMCGCRLQEGIQYAKRVPAKEGIKATYSVESPALKAMFEGKSKKEGLSSQFNVMKTNPAMKAIPTKTREEFQAALRNREGFSNEYMPPQVMRAAKGYTPESPFFGPINL